jgi:signal peptidase I
MSDWWDELESNPDPVQPIRSEEFFLKGLRFIREVLETAVPAIMIALLINLFMAQATRVYGQSMEPNLHSDQRLIVEKLSYHMHPPRRGDVIVLKLHHDNSELLIKRVIGLPGEQVEIKAGRVYVNGVALEEPYLNQYTQGQMAPRVVPPLQVFVLGDNRGFSNDSRSFGMVDFSDIVGRAWFSYWPISQIGAVF